MINIQIILCIFQVTPTVLVIALDDSENGMTMESLNDLFSSENTEVATTFIKAFAETLNQQVDKT